MSVPSTIVFQGAVDLLAADAATFGGAGDGAPVVRLLKTAFTPAPDLSIAAVMAAEADFPGYTVNGIGAATGTQNTAVDPLTGDYLLQLKPPLGGFRWETTGTPSPTQTIYGFAVTDSEGTKVFFSERFISNVVLNGINQVVEIMPPQLRYLLTGVR